MPAVALSRGLTKVAICASDRKALARDRGRPATGKAASGLRSRMPTWCLGIINPDNFLGGRMKLSIELAHDALRRHVAEPLGMKVDEAAAAIYAIQNAQTADLVRKVVVNSGRDPRDFVVYSFGGAGPVHCANYAADLGVSEVIVPLGAVAAVFSAYWLGEFRYRADR